MAASYRNDKSYRCGLYSKPEALGFTLSLYKTQAVRNAPNVSGTFGIVPDIQTDRVRKRRG
jgi:hypothetical protein